MAERGELHEGNLGGECAQVPTKMSQAERGVT